MIVTHRLNAGWTVRALAFAASAALAAGGLAAPSSEPAESDAETSDPYADNACVQCHKNIPGRSAEIVELEWKQSVHHKASVGCEGCHGGDATVDREQFSSHDEFKRAAHLDRTPEFLVLHQPDSQFVSAARGRGVSYFCGKCHSDIKEKHLGSPHGDFGDPTCLYCHGMGSHRITEPSAELIDTRPRSEGGRCSPCHRAATMEAVKRIKETLIKSEDQIERSAELNEELLEWGYRNLSLEELHEHSAEVNSRLRQVFHSFNMREINNFAAEIQEAIDRAEATHERVSRLRREQSTQTIVALGVVTLLLAFAGMLVMYKHVFLDHHGPPG